MMKMDAEALITGRTNADIERKTGPASHSAHITRHYTLKSMSSVARGPDLRASHRQSIMIGLIGY